MFRLWNLQMKLSFQDVHNHQHYLAFILHIQPFDLERKLADKLNSLTQQAILNQFQFDCKNI